MKKQIQALTLMWPNGIPPSDYERALRIASEFGDSRGMANPAPAVAPAPRKVHVRSLTEYVSEEKREKVRQMLTTGRATAREIAGATGIDYSIVLSALRHLGAVDAGRGVRADGRHGRRPVLWALPQKRTP